MKNKNTNKKESGNSFETNLKGSEVILFKMKEVIFF